MKPRNPHGPNRTLNAVGTRRMPCSPSLLSPDELNHRLAQVFDRFRGDRAELIPVLQSVQEALGYLPLDALRSVAQFTHTPASTLYGVVTFYSQFYLSPQGKHKIKVCQGTACHVRGGKAIMRAISRKLGIGPGGTTDDLKFSLERVACFGSCALAPVVVINDRVHGRMTPDKAVKAIECLE